MREKCECTTVQSGPGMVQKPYPTWSLGGELARKLTAALSTGNLDDATGSIDDVIALGLLAGGSGSYTTTCVRFDNGKVKCPGNSGPTWATGNAAHSLFDYRDSTGTAAVTGVSGFAHGGNGQIYCVIKTDQTVYCASYSTSYRQLGNGRNSGYSKFRGVAPSL
jgi:hypothetical protein